MSQGDVQQETIPDESTTRNEDAPVNGRTSPSDFTSSKRPCEAESNTKNKIPRLETAESGDEPAVVSNGRANEDDDSAENNPINETSDLTGAGENPDNQNVETDNDVVASVDVDPVVEPPAATTSSNAPQVPKKEKCWYGARCYRKNAGHRSLFAHPGDDGYDSDPDDPRPTCSYGASCYRRNEDHQAEYKHPDKRRKPGKRKRNVADTKTTKAKGGNGGTSSEDDYDFEDPFFNDDSEDDYVEQSWSEDDSDDDSDLEQPVSDDEDTKGLVKEAKRFTRKRK